MTYPPAWIRCRAGVPCRPLVVATPLCALTHSAYVDQDLKSAGIPKQGPGGRIDFHAIRKAYINLVIESGVTGKEVQALARDSTPELTMNVYGRTRKERLSETAEKVAANILPAADNAIFMPRQAAGAEQESATPIDNREFRLSEDSGGGGNRTRGRISCKYGRCGQKGCKFPAIKGVGRISWVKQKAERQKNGALVRHRSERHLCNMHATT